MASLSNPPSRLSPPTGKSVTLLHSLETFVIGKSTDVNDDTPLDLETVELQPLLMRIPTVDAAGG